MSGNLDELVCEMDCRKMNVVEQLDELRERINKEGVDSAVHKLYNSIKSLKVSYQFLLAINCIKIEYNVLFKIFTFSSGS